MTSKLAKFEQNWITWQKVSRGVPSKIGPFFMTSRWRHHIMTEFWQNILILYEKNYLSAWSHDWMVFYKPEVIFFAKSGNLLSWVTFLLSLKQINSVNQSKYHNLHFLALVCKLHNPDRWPKNFPKSLNSDLWLSNWQSLNKIESRDKKLAEGPLKNRSLFYNVII